MPCTSAAARKQEANVFCEDCNIVMPSKTWFSHCKTTTHKDNTSRAINGQIKQIKSHFKNRVATYTYKKNVSTINLDDFMKDENKNIIKLLMSSLATHNTIKFNMELVSEYIKLSDKELVLAIINHITKMTKLTRAENIEEVFNDQIEVIKSKMSEFQERDSGWTLIKIDRLDININKASIIKGSLFIKTPKKLHSKRACINIANNDVYCFKWCLIAALDSTKHQNAHRVSTYKIPNIKSDIITLENGIILNFTNLEFPMSVNDLDKFEMLNQNISVNVFGYDKKGNEIVGPYRGTKLEKQVHVNLLLLEEGENAHYILVKNKSR